MSDDVTFRDRYRLLLTDREQYLVRTIRGSEVLARWDASDQQFRRIAASSDGPRNTPIPSELVAAVATCSSLGTLSGPKAKPTRWTPFDLCARDTTPPKTTVGESVLAIIAAKGPQTSAQLCQALSSISARTVRSVAVNLAGRQQVGRSIVMVGNRAITAWTIGTVTYEPRQKTGGRPLNDEAYTPTKWIHPIRRLALGLPVAQTPRVETDTDYAHPRRVA
jgi:hypothetical protein